MKINDYEIFTNPMLLSNDLVQYRFPKSKRKRIRRKWAKKQINYKFKKSYKSIILGKKIFIHPDVEIKLKNYETKK